MFFSVSADIECSKSGHSFRSSPHEIVNSIDDKKYHNIFVKLNLFCLNSGEKTRIWNV